MISAPGPKRPPAAVVVLSRSCAFTTGAPISFLEEFAIASWQGDAECRLGRRDQGWGQRRAGVEVAGLKEGISWGPP